MLAFFRPHPKGCIHDGWRGRFTKLEYLILNQDQSLSELAATVTAGTALTGEQSAEGESGPIFDGSVDGNAVGWKVRIVDPARMTLEYQGTVWGNTMTGNMKAGRFGAWPFVGRRQ